MTVIAVDPRVIAESLHIDTDDLARLLTRWAAEALPSPNYDKWEPTALKHFDERVRTARAYLVDAHKAQKAWNQDNPPDPEPS